MQAQCSSQQDHQNSSGFSASHEVERVKYFRNSPGCGGTYSVSLTNLTDLRMSRCELKAISQAVGNLRDLEGLDLSQNYVVDLPDNPASTTMWRMLTRLKIR